MNTDFIDAIHELEKSKGVSSEVLFDAIEAALISAYNKNFGSKRNVRTVIDRETGEITVYSCKTVVEQVEDDRTDISFEAAQKANPNYELGDIVEEEVTPVILEELPPRLQSR